MLWESSTLCRLELISNIHRQRDSIINEVCDEQADEVADTTNLHGEYELRGCKHQNELDDIYKMSPEIWMSHPLESQWAEAGRKCLPQQLSRLSMLQNLNLSFNYLTGEIPVNLSHCVNLKNLVLEHNALLGKIPKQGQVPASFARLTKLRLLGLSVNSLSGEFPPPLYDLSSLVISDPNYFPNFQILYLVKCQFIGSIPFSLANASKLLELHFPVNNFTGNIPKGFDNLRNLLWLNVWSNQLGYGKRDDLDLVNSLTNCQQSRNALFVDNQFEEYGMGSKVSVLGDMYSFGILILEIFTGRRPTDTLFQASSSLHNFVETALPEKVMEILNKTTFHGVMSKATNGKEY
uniref:Leucine rich repeat containing protein, putative n=1 Tax=Solanum demissum TaxID=50514 RepID=Q60D15_SOLDE|nr:Leucine rich repeat containing protein, putative [Solanum demissum]